IVNLSHAQSRWAVLSIRLGLAKLVGSIRSVIVIDEPERALHRRAERRLAYALREMANEFAVPVIVATHSPAFLEDRRATLHHVSRDTYGWTVTSPVPKQLLSHIEDLGLDVADLLQFCRVILLVEGQHELVIFRTLFGDRLAAAGIELFSVRGARSLRTAAE